MANRVKISAAEARRVALAAQGFADAKPSCEPSGRDLNRVLKRVGLLQIDSVNVIERAHYLPLFSRLGPYRRELLDRAAHYAPRRLFEYWGHEASLIPVATQPFLRWRMERAHTDSWGGMQRVWREQPELVDRVLAEVAERGPVAASEIAERPRRAGPWWDWSEHKHYVLPFLLGHRLVARVDLKADRARGVLLVRREHHEPGAPPETGEALDGELASMARWLGLERVERG